MANLKAIKKRIGTVKNTQKITKAMKMVAAAKLRRAQQAVISARPFMHKIEEVVKDLSSRLSGGELPAFLRSKAKIREVRVIVFSSNRGLCGAFNSGLLRHAENFVRVLQEKKIRYQLCLIGKKANEYFRVRKYVITEFHPEWSDSMSFETAKSIAEKAVADFKSDSIDECYFIYNRFASAISQVPTREKLLPLSTMDASQPEPYGIDYLYEPGKKEILKDLMPRYLASKIHMYHKESLASELGARMTAMDNATKNASEMISKLTLVYNRVRQAAITSELLDIVNGAESLK
jgi:F-type H+-transporting ATPase subunit gamma